MQTYRRLERNHALDYALRCAEELGKPLVVYEGLRIDYPWASRRHHRFVLEGMQANAARAAELGLNYWPFVETEKGQGRGLLRRLAERACLVVTDDFPCFIVPPQAEALARKIEVPLFAVDSNSVVPLSLLGPAVSAAAHLRPRIHKAFAEAWPHRAAARPRIPDVATKRVKAPFDAWKAKDVAAFVDGLPLDATVPPVAADAGRNAGRARAPARVPEEAPPRVRGGALGAALARRGPRERPLAVPPLRPRLDRGGRRGGARHDREVVARRAPPPQPGQARGLLLRRRRRELLSRRGAHLAGRRLPVALVPPRRRGEPRDGTPGLGAPDPGSARRGPPPLALRGRGARERRDPRPALERRATGAGGDRHDPQLPADAVGQEGTRVVGLPRRGLPRRSSTSTTSTRSTAATRTPTPASSGASASSTGRGRRSGRSSEASATCRPTTPPASST